MMSTAIPVLSVVVGTIFAYLFAANFDMSNVSPGPLRHRHRRRRHALDPGHHAGHGRLRAHRRQRRRQRPDDRPGRGSPATDRRPGLAGQHHGRHGQGLRHRLGGPDGPGPAGLLRRGDQGRPPPDRPDDDPVRDGLSPRDRQGAIHGFHALLQRQPDEPARPRRGLPRLDDGLLPSAAWP